jgi:zinc protease
MQLDDPWIYRGTDIPQDPEWKFGEMSNGLRYAVRKNGVPPGQVSIRIRIDAGSLYETDAERGYAHLIEHLTFRESKFVANGTAIATFQRLGATFGSDTNAETTPTQTVYKLDLPNTDRTKLVEALKLLSGMIREPALSTRNLAADVPIVMAEARENGGAQRRVGDASRSVMFAGQLLASRATIGTTEALQAATSDSVRAFHHRWYRPENTVIVIAGDGPPEAFATMIEQFFADWRVSGAHVPQPDFGQPKPPKDAAGDNPVDGVKVIVEPDLPRTVSWAILRPWEQVTDNLEYNRGLMIDQVAQAIINRRLESRARAGASYLFAAVNQDDVSRSADGTFLSVTPLDGNWPQAIKHVRGVIEDALTTPPTEEEIERELAEFDVIFANMVEQRVNQPGARLADDLVQAVDIREAVASPETILSVFRSMRDRIAPQAVLEHTRTLFSGVVTRATYVTPVAKEATEKDLRQALIVPVEADGSSRIAAQSISFDELPPIGEPAQPVSVRPIGVLEVEQVDFANGVKALIWRTEHEPGRATVRVRFGSGYRAFSAEDAPYISLGQMALVSSGLGPLGAEELDRISTGRKMGFDFSIGDGIFTFNAQTRPADIADQLYLFAAKLAMPRWDPNPVQRAMAAAKLGYESYGANPMGVINRDLEYRLSNQDRRFVTPMPDQYQAATADGFRKVWEPLLKQGPIEVLVFGDIDRAATIEALSRTFGALPPRQPIPAEALARRVSFPPVQDKPVVEYHRGDPDAAAAVVAWPTGGGAAKISESRQLEILGEVFANRLLDAIREKSGASYAPNVGTNWPVDVDSGGRIVAIAQMTPSAIPDFFAQADAIAADLATNGPSADELGLVVEPMRQMLDRALSGHQLWMNLLEGATQDPGRIANLRSLMSDYTETSPERLKELAARYLASRKGWRMAVIPQGEKLASGAKQKAMGR